MSFINELAEEVQKRLQSLDMKGRCITLKVSSTMCCAKVAFFFFFKKHAFVLTNNDGN